MKKAILYVDDEPLNLMIFEYHLKAFYTIHTADNAAKALEVLASQPSIDSVISDMRMPGVSGLEFIALAKEKYPTLKYYILTAFPGSAELREAIDSKIILTWFSKPLDPLVIRNEIV